ncbi:MAG TPA: NRAMP family divalent metal transporter [Candidatus Dormibacteraeota bacterium]|nr:NRAMP family divalent metal transporter [Candidatus Dormibacteraeota bacterium]
MANLLDDETLDSAVIDAAHLGDIRGAWGTLRWRQLWPPRTLRGRLGVLAAVMGPGLLALIAGNDAGGVATYAQAGQEQGIRLLWVLVPLGLVLFVNQEMAARLGAVSGVGHARLIVERFGRLWGAFSLGDLLLLNVLTLVTEFIGVRIAAEHLGVPSAPAVGVAALVLIAATLAGGFQRWERVMLLLVAVDVALMPLLLLAHPVAGGAATTPGAPAHPAGLQSAVVLIVALMGTTVAPWQLFFQQSATVDKRITPRWLAYARVDTAMGTVLMLAGAAAVMAVSASAFAAGGAVADGEDVGGILAAVGSHLGPGAGDLLALLLFDSAVLGAAAVAMASSYAVGDVTGARHSLHRTPRQAPLFYAVATLVVAVTAGAVLLPGLDPDAVTVSVQVLAGLLLPGATVFMLLLCNDTAVLGPWSNGRWLNAVAATSVAALLALSGMLVVTALYPDAPAVGVGAALGGAAALGLLAVGLSGVRRRRRAERGFWTAPAATPQLRLLRRPVVVLGVPRGRAASPLDDERAFWRTPPLAELRRPVWTAGRLAGMVALRGYVVLSVLLLAGRAVATALRH